MRFGKVLQHHHKHVWVVQLKGEGEEGGGGKSNKSSQVHACKSSCDLHACYF